MALQVIEILRNCHPENGIHAVFDFNGIITFVISVKHSLKSNSIITTDGTIVLSNVIS